MNLPGYDNWKCTPPEEPRDTCPSCGEQEGFEGDQCKCGWDADDAPEGPDRREED